VVGGRGAARLSQAAAPRVHGPFGVRAARRAAALGELEGERAGPRTPAEEVLAAIWAQVLDLDTIGIDDNFFEFGGDSIRSLQVVSRAQERGLNISIAQIFQQQTIRALANALAAGTAQPAAPEHEPFALVAQADRLPPELEDAYPLTMLQAGMLFLMEYHPDSAIYHNLSSVHLRAPFDEGHFLAAVEHLVARHATLRTSFDLGRFSEPLQLVHRAARLPVTIADLRGQAPEEQERAISDWFAGEQAHRFNISRPPLLRFAVHRRNDDSFQFSWSEHHAIIDGWSVATMLSELFQHYMLLLGQAAALDG
jgi:aryl carrier-like protein